LLKVDGLKRVPLGNVFPIAAVGVKLSGKYGRIVLSVSMRLMRVGPAACPIHGRPVSAP
jgi:hypothetical protein